jgi:hypothetical protein
MLRFRVRRDLSLPIDQLKLAIDANHPEWVCKYGQPLPGIEGETVQLLRERASYTERSYS